MSSLSVILTNDLELPEDIFQAICERVFNEIVDRTPVDTGACAAAWTISFLDDGECEISNPIQYTSFLEDGWSKQSPNGMVQVTLDHMPQIMGEIL